MSNSKRRYDRSRLKKYYQRRREVRRAVLAQYVSQSVNSGTEAAGSVWSLMGPALLLTLVGVGAFYTWNRRATNQQASIQPVDLLRVDDALAQLDATQATPATEPLNPRFIASYTPVPEESAIEVTSGDETASDEAEELIQELLGDVDRTEEEIDALLNRDIETSLPIPEPVTGPDGRTVLRPPGGDAMDLDLPSDLDIPEDVKRQVAEELEQERARPELIRTSPSPQLGGTEEIGPGRVPSFQVPALDRRQDGLVGSGDDVQIDLYNADGLVGGDHVEWWTYPLHSQAILGKPDVSVAWLNDLVSRALLTSPEMQALSAQTCITAQTGQSNAGGILGAGDTRTAELLSNYRESLQKCRTGNGKGTLAHDLAVDIGRHEQLMGLQNYASQIIAAYWELYFHRGTMLQRKKNLDRAGSLVEGLQRVKSKTRKTELVRAQAAAAARQSEMFKARTNVANAQDRLRAMVEGPEFQWGGHVELLPQDTPAVRGMLVDFQSMVQTALRNRPEIRIAEDHLVGEERTDKMHDRIWSRRSGQEQQQRHARELYDAIVAEVSIDVRAAVRSVERLHLEIDARKTALVKARQHASEVFQRYERTSAGNASALMLEDLLDAQDRLFQAENSFLRTQADFAFAIADVRRADGTLLRYQESGPRQVPATRQPAPTQMQRASFQGSFVP